MVCLCACLIEIDYTETTLGIAIFFVFSFSALNPLENFFAQFPAEKSMKCLLYLGSAFSGGVKSSLLLSYPYVGGICLRHSSAAIL